MVKVTITNEKIKIVGHAGYAQNGKDIVCASVSSIVITSVNAILRLENESIFYQEQEGMVEIQIIKHNHITDTLILNMIELLKELEKEYPKYIKSCK